MRILMDSMINSNSQYQQKCLIGHGITLSQLNSSFKRWFMKKALFTTQNQNKVNSFFRDKSQKVNKLSNMDSLQNINSINSD